MNKRHASTTVIFDLFFVVSDKSESLIIITDHHVVAECRKRSY